jgi:hypothetical protein
LLIENRDVKELKKYAKNARRHPKKQIEALVQSITQFGFRFPILLDRDGVIISGHGRLEAAIKMGLKAVPCVIADDLTPEQANALRLADNSIGTLSTWDTNLLADEIAKLENLDIEMPELDIPPFDMGLFGFDTERLADKTPTRLKQNMENFMRLEYEQGHNDWDIPETQARPVNMDGVTWFNFNNKEQITDPANSAIHFYIEDYQFDVVWNQPDKYLPLFKSVRAVVAVDFSVYTDMPKAMRLWAQFKRQTLAKHWQDNGVNVISSLSWAHGMIEPWTFAGIPHGGPCAVQYVGHGADKGAGVDELATVLEMIKPSQLFIKVSEKNRAQLEKAIGPDFYVIPPFQYAGRKERNAERKQRQGRQR